VLTSALPLLLAFRDSATDTLFPPIEPGKGLPDWVFTEKLVAKPDQLIKRRGKAGLLCLNKDYKVAGEWIKEKAGKPVKVSTPPKFLVLARSDSLGLDMLWTCLSEPT
jgi:hypothetical protein